MPRTKAADRLRALAPAEAKHRKKLTLRLAERIRGRHHRGDKPDALAHDFGVCRATIYNVISGDFWISQYPVCARGHPHSEEDYIRPDGSRECRQCKRDRERAWSAKNRPPEWHRAARKRKAGGNGQGQRGPLD